MSVLRLADVDVRGKRVFVRADLNVPQDDQGRITDDTRVQASVPALRDALARGAAVMVTSHLGRPAEGRWKPEDSLAPVAARLGELLNRDVPLVRDWIDGGPWHEALAPGDIVMLENCRMNRGEKADDPRLAQKMAKLCDVYVNDAFGTAHRAEATTHGIARYAPIACAGPLMAAELEALGRALANPKRPLVAIVAGSKVSTKLTILRALAAKVDTLIVGGGIANTFILANGGSIGQSLAEPALALAAPKVRVETDESVLHVPFRNTGGGTLVLETPTVGTDDGIPWLTAELEAASIRLEIDRDALGPGTYTGHVDVGSNGGGGRLAVVAEVAATPPLDVGPVVILLRDVATQTIVATTTTTVAEGYRYRFDDVPPGSYEILATTDRDGDGALCDLGESCGAYPDRSDPSIVTVIGGTTIRARDFALRTIVSLEDRGL